MHERPLIAPSEWPTGLHGLDMAKVREFNRAGHEPISGPEQQPDGSWAVRVGTVPRAIKARAVTSTPTDGLRGEERRLLSIGSKAARFRF